MSAKQKIAKPKTVESINAQIAALEFRVANLISSGGNMKQIFALNGKIRNLKHELREVYNYNWLAK